AVTVIPSACSRVITPFQLDASANAPWTRTTVGVSDMSAPFVLSAQRPEGRAQLAREEIRLLPRGEVIAAVDFVEVDEVRVRLLGPAPRRLVELAREDADGRGDGGALDVEEAERVLPVEAARGDPRVRHPGHRDVVEDLVAGQVADRLAVDER